MLMGRDMDQELVNEFLLECVIPGFRESLNDAHKLIGLVVATAHRDTMIGARYRNTPESERYCDNSKYYRDTLIRLIEDSTNNISGRKILSSLYGNYNKHNVNIGLIQKLVNMSVKYLFVIETCGLFNNKPFIIHVDIRDCDCPLDSKILKRLKFDTGKSYTAWTKMSEVMEYKEIQDGIEGRGYNCKLQYDLEFWGLAIER